MLAFEAALLATKGARAYQEDAAIIAPDTALRSSGKRDGLPNELVAVLADGMGGHAGGALASRMVCEHFLTGFAEKRETIRERLEEGLSACNRAIATKVADNPALAGMGSTLIGANFGAGGLEWVSVGDSPLYLYRRGEIAPVNADHSLAPALDQLVQSGKMTPADAKHHPSRHMLRSAVTGEELDLVDISHQPLVLEAGDCVVLASDGIHTIDGNEVARVITAYEPDGVEAIAGALMRAIELARDPYQDNATIIVVRPVAL